MYVYILCVSGLLPTKCKAFEDRLLILLFTTENSILISESVTIRFEFLQNHTGKLPRGGEDKRAEGPLRSLQCTAGRGSTTRLLSCWHKCPEGKGVAEADPRLGSCSLLL